MTIYAHRGLVGEGRVENSREALVAAQEAGCGFETDLRLTSDQVPVLFHDRTVGGVAVSDMTHGQLNEAASMDVPTLEWLVGTQWHQPVNLEIKTMEAWLTSRSMIRSWTIPGELLLISSFDHQVAESVREAGMNGARLYASAPAREDRIPDARTWLSNVVLDINIATAEFIDRLQDADHIVYVYGAQTSREHERMFEWHVDGIITDHPAMAMSAGFRMDS